MVGRRRMMLFTAVLAKTQKRKGEKMYLIFKESGRRQTKKVRDKKMQKMSITKCERVCN